MQSLESNQVNFNIIIRKDEKQKRWEKNVVTE